MNESAHSQPIEVADRIIGDGAAPLIVAEMSANHNGDLGRALAIIDAAADAGAGAIKLQTYTADSMTIDCDASAFRISADHPLWAGLTLHALYRQAATPYEWHEQLFARAHERGIVAFSSPFDAAAVALLDRLGAPLFKVASLEIGDLCLLRAIARTGKPVVLSNGASSLADLERAIRVIRAEGNDQIVVLHCTSAYPADPHEANLRTLPVLRQAFGVPVGLSDHTPGIGVAVASVALGACLIEKHVTLARADGGPDAAFSLEPSELASLVIESARAAAALGDVTLRPVAGEAESLRLRRSLYVVRDVVAGEPVSRENVRAIRPAGGLEPWELDRVMGRSFTRSATAGTPLTWELM